MYCIYSCIEYSSSKASGAKPDVDLKMISVTKTVWRERKGSAVLRFGFSPYTSSTHAPNTRGSLKYFLQVI